MWPFKTTQQKIDRLEDELARKTAEVNELKRQIAPLIDFPRSLGDKIVKLVGDIAVLQAQLVRLKSKINNEAHGLS